MATTAQLGSLRGADGSAVFSSDGISVLASVSGPLEVQRRDEIPDEAAIEVNIRPVAGVGAVRERHFESILHKVLHQVIKVGMHPRTLIQVTLQVTAVPDEDATTGRPSQAASILYLLPPLLNAAMLALLSTSIPLAMTMASVFLTVDSGGSVVAGTPLRILENASSIHALAFSLQGGLLMVESEGSFDLKTWETVAEIAESKCRDSTTIEAGQEDVEMKGDDKAPLETLIRGKVEEKFSDAEQWRHDIK